MDKTFRKFKRKARLQAIISAALFGLCSGVAVTAVLMLFGKLAGNSFDTMHVLIGIGVAVVVVVPLYFIFMPTDMRLAERLDKIYSLDEKVSTMVEFRDESGAFYHLQREDATEKLADKPLRAMKSKAVFVSLLAFFLSVVMLVGAVAMPIKAYVEPPIDEFDKQWILASLDEIIAMVQNSYMTDRLKDDTLDELDELVKFVEESNLLSEMKKQAIKNVSGIDEALEKANTAASIGEKFTASPDEKLSALGEQLKSLSGTASKDAILELCDALIDKDYDDISFAGSEINSYLAASGAAMDDSVYIIFKALASEMQNGSKSDIEAAFEDASKKIVNEVIIQNVNATTVGIVITDLCNLFGITSEDLENEGVDVVIPDRDAAEQLPEDEDKKNDNDNPMGSGGLGTGDVIYGSNDMIYDPNRNTYVPYGVLLNEYFAKANELITDGKASDEAAALAEYYYGLLFGSHSDDESN